MGKNAENQNTKRRSTFAVLFYINRTKVRKDGMCQLLCKVSIDAEWVQIGTKVSVNPTIWNPDKGRAIGRSENAVIVNRAIDDLTNEITGHYHRIKNSLGFITAELVKNAVKGIGQKPLTLLALFREHNEEFKKRVQESLRRQVAAINKLTARGMYFFDYGNAFLLQSSRAGADIMAADGHGFRYPSYVQDIMGPMFFDYGFGPFRWVCTSCDPADLALTDKIAEEIMMDERSHATPDIQHQLDDNIHWIREAGPNHLVVGSQARILYADCEGRTRIALAFNEAVKDGRLKAPVVLGRDHHDVSGTDSPFRETSNIYDGSQFCADMAVQNVIGDSFRGATWVSIHNGGGVGWGEVINGGFGMVVDGSEESSRNIREMLFWDVNNGISRRAWARNKGSMDAIQREMDRTPDFRMTMPNLVDDNIIDTAF